MVGFAKRQALNRGLSESDYKLNQLTGTKTYVRQVETSVSYSTRVFGYPADAAIGLSETTVWLIGETGLSDLKDRHFAEVIT